MKRATLVSQGTLNRIFQEVNEAWKRCDFEAAVAAMERARRLDPANINILLDLGRMHGKRYEYSAAGSCFDKAVRLSGENMETFFNAGQRSLDFGNFDMARRYLESAAHRPNASASILVKLAEVYERLRRIEDAASLTDRALHKEPEHASALLLRTRLERQAGKLAAAELALKAFPAAAEPALRANAAYELGGILDRQGRYDEAMSAFQEAKGILQPQAAPCLAELKVIRQRIKDMQAGLKTDLFQRWFAEAPVLTPPRRLTLLGGHPRSGTTLLEQVLDSHPNIISAEETEIFNYDAFIPLARSLRLPPDSAMLPVLEAATPETLRHTRANYFNTAARFLGQPIGNRLLIDKNPSLTFLISPIIRVFPEIKLLIALRDPRDVVLSCFMQPMPLGQGSSAYLTLESTVQEYCSMMTLWQTLKPMIEGHYLEVRYEDMVDDLESVARKSLDFLGMPWDAKVLGFDEHARKKLVRSPTYADVTQPVYKRAKGRWRNYQKYLEPHLEKLEPFVKAFGYE